MSIESFLTLKPSKARLIGISVLMFGISLFLFIELWPNPVKSPFSFAKLGALLLVMYPAILGVYYLVFTAFTLTLDSISLTIKRLWPPRSFTSSMSEVEKIHLRWTSSVHGPLAIYLHSMSVQLKNGRRYHFVTFFFSLNDDKQLVHFIQQNFKGKISKSNVRFFF